MVTLRSSTVDDAARLNAAVDAVARERRYLAATEGFGVDATRGFIQSILDGRSVQLLALSGDAVVGWCDVLRRPFDGMRHVGQLGMGVVDGWRGQGIGQRLLRETLDLARRAGMRRVELEVFASNWSAVRLYERHGFTLDGRKRGARHLQGVDDDILVMSLDLGVCDQAGPREPDPIGSPVLDSVLPVVATSRHVKTNLDKLVDHARWLAYEELPLPEFGPPFDPGSRRDDIIDFVLVSTCINSAFTDFSTGQIFAVDYEGRRWYDAEAMMACLRRALADGIPVLDGRFLATVTLADLRRIFAGTIEMPMLAEKHAILNGVGTVLARDYDGRFARFVDACPPRLFDHGRGLVERLVREFPRFDDVSPYRGRAVRFYKLAQLGFWILTCTLRRHGGVRIDDLSAMTAFADYIVPMALRAMRILEYEPALDDAIAAGRLIPRDSEEEVEIRAHTLYATALLREEVNARRPADRQVIIPQVDARLWVNFHHTPQRHHLTKTVMY